MTAPLTPATIAPHLQTRWLGRTLHCLAELDSTNTTARELAAAGAADGTVVIAEAQRAGRGRLGRSWASPAGKKIHFFPGLRLGKAAQRPPPNQPLTPGC